MPSPNIQLAKYSILLGYTATKQPVIVLYADELHTNVPAELRALVADIEPSRPLKWRPHEAADERAGSTITLKAKGAPFVIEAADFSDVLSGTTLEELSRLLTRVTPAINDEGDLVQIALGQAQMAFGRHYPSASPYIDDGKVVVASDTAIAQRTTSSSAPRAPRRVKGTGDQIHVWLGGGRV